MNVCKAVKKLNTHQSNVLARKNYRVGKTMYTCSGCKYKSNRQYNVQRHEQRIHWNRRLRFCCGEKFYNKGDYYIHCEEIHPRKRKHAITSRKKYKITQDFNQENYQNVPPRRFKQKKSGYNVRLTRRFSERIRIRERGKVESKVSVKYSVTYSDFDVENIPLISFLTDRRLKSRLKRLSRSKLGNDINDETREDTNETVKIAISSEQNVEKVVFESNRENLRTKVSDSSVTSVSVELPTKKLILHRFRTSVKQEYELPLREQNNNCVEVNFAEKHAKENTAGYQSRTKNSKRPFKANKENVSKFAFSLEEELNINLDSGITVPLVTQLHRDFLSSIDFDKYKIF